MGTFTARAIRIRIHRSSMYCEGIRPSNRRRKAAYMERATRAISASRKNIARVRRISWNNRFAIFMMGGKPLEIHP